MHLSGEGIFGPPKDRDAALAVLREAVAAMFSRRCVTDDVPGISSMLGREDGILDVAFAVAIGEHKANVIR
jgi:pyridoxine 4-dehydrogenase